MRVRYTRSMSIKKSLRRPVATRLPVFGWGAIAIGGMLLILAIAVGHTNLSARAPRIAVQLGGTTFEARVASTPEARQKGLSGVTTLGGDQALLFIFASSDTYRLWMKDMLISIDVVWLDESQRVISTMTNLTPDSYPKTFSSDAPARYALELPAGTVEQKNIKKDDRASFDVTGIGVR